MARDRIRGQKSPGFCAWKGSTAPWWSLFSSFPQVPWWLFQPSKPQHAQKYKVLPELHTGNELQETQYQNTAFHWQCHHFIARAVIALWGSDHCPALYSNAPSRLHWLETWGNDFPPLAIQNFTLLTRTKGMWRRKAFSLFFFHFWWMKITFP